MHRATINCHGLRQLSARQFHAALSACMPRQALKTVAREADSGPFPYDLPETFEDDDTTAAGHIMLWQERQTLHYLRLIEHEMPKLVAYRKPFISPTISTPLIVRTISYCGEEHPATLKRTIVVPVARLLVDDEEAIHKLKLLAGVRWTPTPPRDSGVSVDDRGGHHGYIKISCEDFPQARMNLKWASDTLDRLISEANNSTQKLGDIPIDTRHVEAKALKAKTGEHFRGCVFPKPSLNDFPKDWLPPAVTFVAPERVSLLE